MSKRLKGIALFLVLIMSISVLWGCATQTPTEVAEPQIGAETGDGDVTEFDYWTFVDLHEQHFEKMLGFWNEEYPDKQIKLNVTVMPYDDMHNKLLIALQTGKGAPDISDIEIDRFPNFLEGDEISLVDLTDAVEPYRDSIVESRLELYSKNDKVYGFPTHAGATVAFYNTEMLEEAGIDYTKIITWDDYKEAGIKLYEKTGKYMGEATTKTLRQAQMICAQQGTDLVNDAGEPQVNSPEMIKGYEMLKDLQNNNVIATIAGGHLDTEEGKGQLNQGNYATALYPEWFVSRYVNEMKDLEGKIAIAPAPVFEVGQPRSLGGGGTGTVVTKTAKDIDLAKDFLTFAKITERANIEIWNTLGFDPVNTDVWQMKDITHNPDNKYVKYFLTNPFDVLNEIKDEIQLIKSVKASPIINSVLSTVTFNAIFEDGQDVTEALNEAQEMIEQELK